MLVKIFPQKYPKPYGACIGCCAYLDPVEFMLVLLLALSESPRLMTFRPAKEKFRSLK